MSYELSIFDYCAALHEGFAKLISDSMSFLSRDVWFRQSKSPKRTVYHSAGF